MLRISPEQPLLSPAQNSRVAKVYRMGVTMLPIFVSPSSLIDNQAFAPVLENRVCFSWKVAAPAHYTANDTPEHFTIIRPLNHLRWRSLSSFIPPSQWSSNSSFLRAWRVYIVRRARSVQVGTRDRANNSTWAQMHGQRVVRGPAGSTNRSITPKPASNTRTARKLKRLRRSVTTRTRNLPRFWAKLDAISRLVLKISTPQALLLQKNLLKTLVVRRDFNVRSGDKPASGVFLRSDYRNGCVFCG